MKVKFQFKITIYEYYTCGDIPYASRSPSRRIPGGKRKRKKEKGKRKKEKEKEKIRLS